MSHGEQLTDLLAYYGHLAHSTAERRGFYFEGWGLLAGAAQLASEVTELAGTLTPEDEALELADCMIAILSIAHHRGIKLGPAVLRKMAINLERANAVEAMAAATHEEVAGL